MGKSCSKQEFTGEQIRPSEDLVKLMDILLIEGDTLYSRITDYEGHIHRVPTVKEDFNKFTDVQPFLRVAFRVKTQAEKTITAKQEVTGEERVRFEALSLLTNLVINVMEVCHTLTKFLNAADQFFHEIADQQVKASHFETMCALIHVVYDSTKLLYRKCMDPNYDSLQDDTEGKDKLENMHRLSQGEIDKEEIENLKRERKNSVAAAEEVEAFQQFKRRASVDYLDTRNEEEQYDSKHLTPSGNETETKAKYENDPSAPPVFPDHPPVLMSVSSGMNMHQGFSGGDAHSAMLTNLAISENNDYSGSDDEDIENGGNLPGLKGVHRASLQAAFGGPLMRAGDDEDAEEVSQSRLPGGLTVHPEEEEELEGGHDVEEEGDHRIAIGGIAEGGLAEMMANRTDDAPLEGHF